MNMSNIVSQPLLEEVGQVIVLEAAHGEHRYNYLQQCLKKAHDCGVTTWLLNCDRTMGGSWAGLKDLLAEILPQVQAQAPDLIIKHDYELTRVLPELRRLISVRYPSLTDIATEKEQNRNYPADRASRIIHGIIDFLTAWFERSQTSCLIIACDNYDFSGGLVRIFFAELMRRRANKLNLALLVAVSNEAVKMPAIKDVIGKFNQDSLHYFSINLPISTTTEISRQ